MVLDSECIEEYVGFNMMRFYLFIFLMKPR